jgi:hypothetical protein
MPVLVVGKTICPLCGQAIFSVGDSVGFPRMEMPHELGFLSGSMVHRTCLLEHPSIPTITRIWSEYWRLRARHHDIHAEDATSGVIYQVEHRAVFISFDTFLVIEESALALGRLWEFFTDSTFGLGTQMSSVRNNYTLSESHNGYRLIVESIPSESAVSILNAKPTVVVDYSFSRGKWSAFQGLWSQCSTSRFPASS